MRILASRSQDQLAAKYCNYRTHSQILTRVVLEQQHGPRIKLVEYNVHQTKNNGDLLWKSVVIGTLGAILLGLGD